MPSKFLTTISIFQRINFAPQKFLTTISIFFKAGVSRLGFTYDVLNFFKARDSRFKIFTRISILQSRHFAPYYRLQRFFIFSKVSGASSQKIPKNGLKIFKVYDARLSRAISIFQSQHSCLSTSSGVLNFVLNQYFASQNCLRKIPIFQKLTLHASKPSIDDFFFYMIQNDPKRGTFTIFCVEAKRYAKIRFFG